MSGNDESAGLETEKPDLGIERLGTKMAKVVRRDLRSPIENWM